MPVNLFRGRVGATISIGIELEGPTKFHAPTSSTTRLVLTTTKHHVSLPGYHQQESSAIVISRQAEKPIPDPRSIGTDALPDLADSLQ